MSKTLLLFKIQLLGFFGINRLRYAGTKNDRVKAGLFALLQLVIIAMMAFYSYILAVGYAAIGLADRLPALMVAICAVITLFFTFVKSNGVLFAFKDYDMLMSLPLRSSQVIASRLLTLYAGDIIFSAVAFVPVMIVFLQETASAPLWVLPAALVTLLLTPLIPMIIAMILGALIAAISARFRYKNLVVTVLSLALTLGAMSLSFSLQNSEQLTELGYAVDSVITRYYPPALLVDQAFSRGNIGALALYALLSLGASALFIMILGRVYNQINSALLSRVTKSNYRLGALSSASPVRALFRKEARRLLTSPIYLLNTCIGAVLMVAAAIALVVLSPAQLDAVFEVPGMLEFLGGIAPLALAMFCVTICTTSSSMNLEGKNRWILYTLPVNSRTLFDAKILLNLTVQVPAILISGALFLSVLRLRPDMAVLTFLTPIIYSFFISVLGLAVNLKFPKYDWNSEQQAVKQSMSVMVTMAIGFIAVLAPALLGVYFQAWAFWINVLATLVIGCIGALLYRHLGRIRLYL